MILPTPSQDLDWSGLELYTGSGLPFLRQEVEFWWGSEKRQLKELINRWKSGLSYLSREAAGGEVILIGK